MCPAPSHSSRVEPAMLSCSRRLCEIGVSRSSVPQITVVGTCDRVATAGIGDGGSLATIRFDFPEADSDAVLRQAAQGLVEAVQALPGVTCVHLGIARSEVSGVRTRETELRSAMAEKGFGAVLLVEGASRSGLEAALAEAKQLAIATGALTEPVIDVYETAFSITSEDMQAHNHAQAHQG